MTTMKKYQKYVLLPEGSYDESEPKRPELKTSNPKSNGKRKLIILTSAGAAAIIGLAATNVIGALNASDADAAHRLTSSPAERPASRHAVAGPSASALTRPTTACTRGTRSDARSL